MKSTTIKWEKLSHRRDREKFVHNFDSQKVTLDISFHQHVSNLTSYKDEYDTGCYYSDCLTVVMKLVSLTEIIIVLICLKLLRSLLHAHHHRQFMTDLHLHQYENLKTHVCQFKENKKAIISPVVERDIWCREIIHPYFKHMAKVLSWWQQLAKQVGIVRWQTLMQVQGAACCSRWPGEEDWYLSAAFCHTHSLAKKAGCI